MVRTGGMLGGGMLLGLLVLAADGRADEAAAVKAVQKLGGRITVDAQRPGKPVVAVTFVYTPVTDAGLRELKDTCKPVTCIAFPAASVTKSSSCIMLNVNLLPDGD